MKIKKFLKIFFINILLLAIFFFIYEIISVSILCKLWSYIGVDLSKEKLSYFFPLKEKINEDFYEFRPVEYKKGKKLPIVIFGCSYAYGISLEENETLSYQLSNYTNRTVYNKGVAGGGAGSMLYFLQNPEFKKEIPDAECFIYVFMPDHIRRVYTNSIEWFHKYLRASYYISNNGDLKEMKLNKLKFLLFSTATYRLYSYIYSNKFMYDSKNEYNLFFRILEESNNVIKKEYPNSKFVILVYDNYDKFYSLTLEREEELFNKFAKENNIKVLYTKNMSIGKEIIDGKYYAADKLHPGKKAWEKLVPEISKELNL